MNSQVSDESTTSLMDVTSSSQSSSQSSTPNSRQSNDANQAKKNGFFNFSSSDSDRSAKNNRNNPDDDDDGEVKKSAGRMLTAGTIAEALKQLQLIEEREERERRSCAKLIENVTTNNVETTTTTARLLRHAGDVPLTQLLRRANDDGVDDDVSPLTTPNVDANENRRRPSKNVRRLTLTMASLNAANNDDDDDKKLRNVDVDNDVDNNKTEASRELVAVRREKESLVSAILRMICDLRDAQLSAMSYRVRQRALASKCSAYVTRDFPSLYGRCFNLSMNLKILTQCQHGDSSIAARVLSDFDILEKSLEAKLMTTATASAVDLSAMLQSIRM